MADTPVPQPVDETTTTSTTSSTTTTTTTQSQVEKVLHIRDFLNLTKALRDEFNIFEKKYRLAEPKIVSEWEKITGLIAKVKI